MGNDEFLSDGEIFQLLQLTQPRKSFEDITGYVGPRGLLWAQPRRARYTNPTECRAIPMELELEIDQATQVVMQGEEAAANASMVTPYAPRNYTQVPIFTAFPVSVLSFTVPTGYRYWIDGYAFNLFPDTSNELNYQWQLRVNGQDILNKGNNTATRGRPVQTAEKVTIGRDKASMILAKPGNTIEVVVSAFSNLGASDFVSAAVFGFLEGVES